MNAFVNMATCKSDFSFKNNARQQFVKYNVEGMATTFSFKNRPRQQFVKYHVDGMATAFVKKLSMKRGGEP